MTEDGDVEGAGVGSIGFGVESRSTMAVKGEMPDEAEIDAGSGEEDDWLGTFGDVETGL